MTAREPSECAWKVDGLNLKGLAWGDPADRPVLALHGWLDNAASFALLAPHLVGCYVVAPDLTGHGQSDWRSPDATYQVYDDVPQIIGLVDQLGWESFELVGHSRGAIISSILASAFPERVDHLVLLDGVSPPPLPESEFVSQLRSFVQERKRLLARKPRVYPSVDAAVAAREDQGLSAEAAKLIATRNLRPCKGGHVLTTDPRLRGASAVKLTPGQIDAMVGALGNRTLLLIADLGLAVIHAKWHSTMHERVPRAQVESFSGGHHFHMESEVAKLGARILAFFEDQK